MINVVSTTMATNAQLVLTLEEGTETTGVTAGKVLTMAGSHSSSRATDGPGWTRIGDPQALIMVEVVGGTKVGAIHHVHWTAAAPCLCSAATEVGSIKIATSGAIPVRAGETIPRDMDVVHPASGGMIGMSSCLVMSDWKGEEMQSQFL